MSWTEIVKNANSLKARLDGQKARMPFGRRPYIYEGSVVGMCGEVDIPVV